MNRGLPALEPYPFERLKALTEGAPRADFPAIALSIGEPRHPAPAEVLSALAAALAEGVARYPTTSGSAELRRSIARWLVQRFQLAGVDPDRQVLPVNGTREGLFAVAQAFVAAGSGGGVIAPNPFYQIYEGAALLAGSNPRFVPACANSGYLPDFATLGSDDWQRCQLLYLCNPGNPAGAVMPEAQLMTLLRLAEEHDFIIAADECYSEIYPDEERPPTGLLQAAVRSGNHDYRRCLVFHSLSKRSNLPGLRSGFVAGDADLIATFLRYRTYHGCAMPLHHQRASVVAWEDETHVRANRAHYRDKFNAVLPLLQPLLHVLQPDAGFYLWPETPMDDEAFALRLLKKCNVAVLPGSYLGRERDGLNPGAGHVRIALVAGIDECVEAAERIAHAGRLGW